MLKTLPNNLADQAKSKYQTLIWVIIGFGVLLRVYHYLYNRSLWEDEIYLSTGLVKLSLGELFTKTLDFQQKANIGYSVIVKLCLMMFGNREMALRLFPFICGIASLFVFLPVTRYFLKPVGAVAAMALLAFAPPLLYHAVEAKQYGCEMLGTIIILWLYALYNDKTDNKSIIKWALWGAVIVWVSYSSVLILAGVAFAVGIRCLIKKDWPMLFKLTAVFALWFGSFAVNYVIFTQKDAHTAWLVFFFQKHDAFMPLSAGAGQWLAHRLLSFFNYPMGLSWFTVYGDPSMIKQILTRMVIIPIAFCLIGAYYLYKNNRNVLSLIVGTFAIVFVASAIKLYPFHERLTVFLAPLVILLLAAGCQAIYFKTGALPVWQTVLVLMLLFGPVKNSIAQTFNPGLFGDYKKSYQREALMYLNNHYQPGDEVYAYWNDLPGYRLYKVMYPFKFTAAEGKDHRHEASNFKDYFAKVDSDLAVYKGKKRVWIINNKGIDIPIGDFIGDPAYYYLNNDGIKRFHDHLLQLGKEVDSFKPANPSANTDINVSLMDFSVF